MPETAAYFYYYDSRFNMESPYYQSRKVMIDILEGIKQQENEFVMIFCPDKKDGKECPEDDNWKDPHTWEKANPNIGISVSYDYMERELQDAINKGGTGSELQNQKLQYVGRRPGRLDPG